MYCDCGPGGTKREVLAARVLHLPPVRTYGDPVRKPVQMNRCYSCGKLWPPPRIKQGAKGKERVALP
jgi:hypothetical protein